MTRGCFWRENDEPEKLSRYYQTCSPDLNACPDRFCDPLEIIFPKSCPQDCTGKKLFKILDRRAPVFFFLKATKNLFHIFFREKLLENMRKRGGKKSKRKYRWDRGQGRGGGGLRARFKKIFFFEKNEKKHSEISSSLPFSSPNVWQHGC